MAAPPPFSLRRAEGAAPLFLIVRTTFLHSSFVSLFALLVFGLGSAALPGTCAEPQSQAAPAPVPADGAWRVLEPRCEYLTDPEGIDAPSPRLSWRLESSRRGAAQTAWQVRVASSSEALARGEADLWDSGRREGAATNQIPYGGRTLGSRQLCFWQVRSWDEAGRPSDWSAVARWSMGLLHPEDWSAAWISHRDAEPPHKSREQLHLPPAWHYRRDFTVAKPLKRASIYATALGLYELHCNGRRVGDAYFLPGWSDYAQRAYYRTHDVTALLQTGANALGAIVADGWYSGYVGYGLLVGYGPWRTGRNFYGRTPALRAQLELEYLDGTREVIGTGPEWRTSAEGPFREADLIMGETYDARRAWSDWARPGFAANGWETAVPAEANGSCPAPFSDNTGTREVDLGFRAPARLQAYAAQSIRVTEELPVRRWTEPKPGVHIADLGQNFAGIVRLRVRGPAGATVRLRYGEMLNPDGSLMTENLRRARATDAYTLRGDPAGEEWSPRFTYHGFQYVELTGLPERPAADTLTGLVLHNDAPVAGQFACSDEVMTRFARNAQWTQRANFVEVPTDCPQRDERLGWMGDAQAYVRAATYNADLAAFYTKWFDDVAEAQRSWGAFPDYAPYPMGHGHPGKTFGTAWTDAGVICPWTVWRVYGDTRAIDRLWPALTRFMEWRQAATALDGGGLSLGNPWGDWLNVDDPTSLEYIDTCYHALVCSQMAELAEASGRASEARNYRERGAAVARAFASRYVESDGRLKEKSQTAHVLALQCGVLAPARRPAVALALAERIASAGNRMTTGFLGTRALLPVLSANGQHDLAVRLFQNRSYPSWGYEVVNGATSVWERWDSYTVEHGFNGRDGKQNASMNSFSHYAFGAVMEWAYRQLAGIDAVDAGFRRLRIAPRPPSPGSNPERRPVEWVEATYRSINGPVAVKWRRIAEGVAYEVALPANTTATVVLPGAVTERVREGGRALAQAEGVLAVRTVGDTVEVDVGAGSYGFVVQTEVR